MKSYSWHFVFHEKATWWTVTNCCRWLNAQSLTQKKNGFLKPKGLLWSKLLSKIDKVSPMQNIAGKTNCIISYGPMYEK